MHGSSSAPMKPHLLEAIDRSIRLGGAVRVYVDDESLEIPVHTIAFDHRVTSFWRSERDANGILQVMGIFEGRLFRLHLLAANPMTVAQSDVDT